MKKSIAVLLTVFNRKQNTLECLTELYKVNVPEGYFFDVFLVDDACTDGTPEAVKEQFPEVNIVEGDGALFWNRGMYMAWDAAVKNNDYDFYLWLNDDTILFENSFETMLEASNSTENSSLICGPTCSKKERKVTYGGARNNKDGVLSPNGKLQECEIINGNFVLVPKIIYKKLGNLDWSFRHAIGDYDYGLRAIKEGFTNYLATEFIGTCEANPTLPKWCLKETPFFKRFNLLYSPLGYAEPVPFFIYEKRHFGLGVAVKHFITINLRALIPQLWK